MNGPISFQSKKCATFLPITSLRPNEEYNEDRVNEVLNMVNAAKAWLRMIAVHDTSHAVMDGHHRLEVAKRMGLKYVPCALLSYSQVRVESRRPEFSVTPEEIISRSTNGDLYPEKTTRHIFSPSELECEISLDLLRAGSLDSLSTG